jgi:polyhydroxyalkanoate synthase subunit PhaC
MSIGPDEWVAAAARRACSWWPAWNEWLNEHSSATRIAPPPVGLPDVDMPTLAEAPGTYVLQE